jgi:hypothetical protein
MSENPKHTFGQWRGPHAQVFGAAMTSPKVAIYSFAALPIIVCGRDRATDDALSFAALKALSFYGEGSVVISDLSHCVALAC